MKGGDGGGIDGVHPRVGGAAFSKGFIVLEYTGPSPRRRGSHWRIVLDRRGERSIPA